MGPATASVIAQAGIFKAIRKGVPIAPVTAGATGSSDEARVQPARSARLSIAAAYLIDIGTLQKPAQQARKRAWPNRLVLLHPPPSGNEQAGPARMPPP